jgi:hypothetical protein
MQRIFLLAGVLLLGTPAHACDADDIVKNAEWCFADKNRAGFKDLFAGSCTKSAGTTEAGFLACQAHNENARKGYSACKSAQQVDAVRAAGRNQHVYADLFTCGF